MVSLDGFEFNLEAWGTEGKKHLTQTWCGPPPRAREHWACQGWGEESRLPVSWLAKCEPAHCISHMAPGCLSACLGGAWGARKPHLGTDPEKPLLPLVLIPTWMLQASLPWGVSFGSFTLGTSDFYGDLKAATEPDSRYCLVFRSHASLCSVCWTSKWVLDTPGAENRAGAWSCGIHRLVTGTGIKQRPSEYIMINCGKCSQVGLT